MPLLRITTNISLDDQAAQALCSLASRHVSGMLGKPESYVMVSVQHTAMSFAAEPSPCALLELKSLGLPAQQTAAFSESLCDLMSREAGIPAERIYIEFSSPDRHMWGWDKRTF